jgi:hypothetical protein
MIMFLFYLPQESLFSSRDKFITVVLSLLTLIGGRAGQTGYLGPRLLWKRAFVLTDAV